MTFQPSRDGTPRFDTIVVEPLGRLRRISGAFAVKDQQYELALLAELEHVDEELGLVIQTLAITIPLTLVLAATAAYILAVRALAPVERLCQQTGQITAENLDRRLPVPNPHDELGHLAQTVNSMIERLQRSFEESKRFTADASHELRTPVTVIRSEAELGAESVEKDSSTHSRFRSILEECDRLTSMTSQLLHLSKEDAGVHENPDETADAVEVLSELLASLRPRAEVKRQSLHVESTDDIEVAIGQHRLEQVFQNLLDNALKYTPEGGSIDIRLEPVEAMAVFEVADSGIGIGTTDQQHVFDRFFRVRAGDENGIAGAGLGLSIVKSIIDSAGGRIEVESEVDEGSVFRVYLPLAGRTS